MLQQRILTALVLLAIVLPALWYPGGAPFAALALLLLTAAAWEWGRLNGLGMAAALAVGGACAALCTTAWAAGWLHRPQPYLWLGAAAGWVLAGAALLHGGVAAWRRIPAPLRLAAGVLALWLAWLAAAQARHLGIGFLLSVLLLTWTADIAAYLAGRSVGGRFIPRKLAASISPGKSWEGAIAGLLATLLLAGVWGVLDDAASAHSLYARLWADYGLWGLLAAVAGLTAMSVVGDLLESLVKRSAGAKDSSTLLPGHGGVLDRLDALLPTLPLAMLLAS